MADYRIELFDCYGSRLAYLDKLVTLDYNRVVNSIGTLKATLPDVYDYNFFKIDGRLAVYRDGVLDMESCFLIVDRTRRLTEDGRELVELLAVDPVDLLRRRIVAYNSGSAQASKTAVADDMMKEIVSQNLGAGSTDTDRSIATYLAIQANLSASSSIGKSFSRRNVLTVLQELALSATLATPYTAFDIVTTDPTALQAFEFRTYTSWRGIDHRYPGGVNPVILSAENGTLANVRLRESYGEEVNASYAGGQGVGAARVTFESEDVARQGVSPIRRSEGWTDARDTSSAAIVADESDFALRAGRPRTLFTARITDSQGVRYGKDWKWGDYLTAQYKGTLYDARVESVRVQVDEKFNETIDGWLRAEL